MTAILNIDDLNFIIVDVDAVIGSSNILQLMGFFEVSHDSQKSDFEGESQLVKLSKSLRRKKQSAGILSFKS